MARPGGYIQFEDECYSFTEAICLADMHGWLLNIEASGEHCFFSLWNQVWQARSGFIQEILGFPWPYFKPWREPELDRLDRLGFVEVPDFEPFEECSLWVPYRCLELVKVQVTFEDVDVTRRLVFADIKAIAMSEEGDYCEEFELWLICEYDGELYPACDPIF